MPLLNIDNSTFVCEICGHRRPHDKISVESRDISAQSNLPAGHAMRNINYCNDRLVCSTRAKEKADVCVTSQEEVGRAAN